MNDTIKNLFTLKTGREIAAAVNTLSLEDTKLLLVTVQEQEELLKDFIPPILAGLKPSHFAIFSDSPLFVKRAESDLLQEKMASVTPHFIGLFEEYSKEVGVLLDCINELPLFPVSSDLLASLCDQIVQLSDKSAAVTRLLDQLLKLTWLSHNTELIEIYSGFKNQYAHLNIGVEALSLELMKRLNSIYTNDQDSSIDGLNALGISFLEDLKRLRTCLGDDLADVPEKSLLPAIHDRLNAAGLATVEDLRKHQIFTKEHLFTYLKKSD